MEPNNIPSCFGLLSSVQDNCLPLPSSLLPILFKKPGIGIQAIPHPETLHISVLVINVHSIQLKCILLFIHPFTSRLLLLILILPLTRPSFSTTAPSVSLHFSFFTSELVKNKDLTTHPIPPLQKLMTQENFPVNPAIKSSYRSIVVENILFKPFQRFFYLC